MRWLIRSVSALFAILLVVCIFGALVGRLDHSPSKLQDLGFGQCNGEACFRGIKLGTDWATAQEILPKAVTSGGTLELPINVENILTIRLSSGTESSRTVQFMGVDLAEPGSSQLSATNAGAIVSEYGAPCRLQLYYGYGVSRVMLFIYPTLTVFVDVPNRKPYPGTDFRLQPSSPVVGFWITGTNGGARCQNATTEYVGTWQGFASADVYHARYLHELNANQAVNANGR